MAGEREELAARLVSLVPSEKDQGFTFVAKDETRQM
jgi:hypothetical protein